MKFLACLGGLLLAATLVPAQDGPRFGDVEIEKAYAPYLLAQPLLMEVAGAKMIRLPSGNLLIVGVGAVALTGDSPQDRLKAELVCRQKALASIVAQSAGVMVVRVERLEERTVVVLEGGEEKARSLSDLLQITRSQCQGITRGMSIIGRWKSADCGTQYVAVAAICDRKGNPLPDADPK